MNKSIEETNEINKLSSKYPIIRKFIDNYLENKSCMFITDLDLNINISIRKLLNYEILLTPQKSENKKPSNPSNLSSISMMNTSFTSIVNLSQTEQKNILKINPKSINEINEKKKEELIEIKKRIKEKSDLTKNSKRSILFFEPPEFEVYFILKLYINKIQMGPEYSTRLVFNNTDMNQRVFFSYKYKDLTEDSYISISIYSTEFMESKVIGTVNIPLFKNFLLVQGRHSYAIKSDGNYSTDIYLNEIDKLVNNYNKIFNDNIKEMSIENIKNIPDDEILNKYFYDIKIDNSTNIIQNNLYIKSKDIIQYEEKLSSLLANSSNSYLEIEFPDFEKEVLFEQSDLSINSNNQNSQIDNTELIKKDFKNLWIYDPLIENQMFKEINPIIEKINCLTNTLDDKEIAKDIRPTKSEMDKINELVNCPDFLAVNDEGANLFWKYRYYLQKQNKRNALTKILNQVDWENKDKIQELANSILPNWQTVEIGDILFMLSKNFCVNNLQKENNLKKGYEYVRNFAVKKLNLINDDNKLNFILLQLVQALRYENFENSKLSDFLIERCSKSAILATSFYWFIHTETGDIENSDNEIIKYYQYIEIKFNDKLRENEKIKLVIEKEKQLRKILNEISCEICSIDFKNRSKTEAKFKEYVCGKKGDLTKQEFYMPSAPNIKVNGVFEKKCKVFKSNARPCKYSFKVVEDSQNNIINDDKVNNQESNNKDTKDTKDIQNSNKEFDVIFKYGDDLRQDQLILQIINFMDSILKEQHQDSEFTTYKVLATSKNDGFMEFVTESDNIHEIVKNKKLPLEKYYEQDCKGDKNEINKRHDSFINSCAGYCVVTYLLGIGDRHLGNIMMKKNGRMFHIDFGFILGQEPEGKKILSPLIKIIPEMIECMGGTDSEGFKTFLKKCFNVFSILRDNSRLIVNMFYLMIDSGISGLNNIEDLQNLNNKFFPQLTREDAGKELMDIIARCMNLSTKVINMFLDFTHTVAVDGLL